MAFTPLEILLIVTTLLEFNPLFQTIKSVKNKSMKDVSVMTFLSIFAIGSLWLYYSITIMNIPLLIGNAIKLFSSLSVLSLFIYFRYFKKGIDEQKKV